MTKQEIIEKLRGMAKFPTVTLPRDSEALKKAADLLEEQEQGKIERLTAALEKANAQAEHFEREWYLRGDELEKLKQEQSDKSPPEQWQERWYGSGSEKGWWIVCGRNRIAHLGVQVLGDEVSKVVDAHNRYKPTVQLKEQEQSEPVAWMQTDGDHISFWKDEYHTIPLYTTPQQRKPLTDEQINELRQQYGVTSDGRGIKEFTKVCDFARAIEAAHGIKK